MSSSSFADRLDLAGERAGGCVLAASDDFFAEKENLINATDPVFAPDKYTDHGKWMDGWESRRRRGPGYDWAAIQLGIPGIIRGVIVDTRFFTGNYPEQMSLEAATAETNTRVEDIEDWIEVVPKSPLRGDSLNSFEVASSQRFTHVRLNIFPDGGVARLRVHGEALPDWRHLGPEIDLAAAASGATVIDSSDRHYGHPRNMLMPGRARNMGDGWETRRRRGPGHDWAILRLAADGVIERIEVDTSHFKGNFPDACSLDVSPTGEEGSWTEAVPQSKLRADAQHLLQAGPAAVARPARFARFHIYPDGGISRLHLLGRLSEQGRLEVNLALLNAASRRQAIADFLKCGGSNAWAVGMTGGRPYASAAALEAAADAAWNGCSRDDWLEAFASHPAIGARTGGEWSRREQSGMTGAGSETQSEIEALNRSYREKFGYTFIVCATGRTADEMIDILRRRIGNRAEDELQKAAAEQRQIARLRLRKLLSE